MSQRSAHSAPVVLLMGPTGAGKTDLAIRLAARFPVEIVSVDSAMVYRGLDIGTGKPPPAVLARHPHRLVDILDPVQAYSAGQFVRDARRAIEDIRARGKLPLLAGGTMLYFRALRYGLAELPAANPEVRARIDAEAERAGWPAMHTQLARIDPQAAARIQPNDSQRIQRALEVYRVSGRTLSELHVAAAPPASDLKFAPFVWSPADRQVLHQIIERRFHAMMAAGFLDEVRRLYARGDLDERLPSIRSVGYRQLWEHLNGQTTLEVAVQRAIFATRQLARRQLIWLRSELDAPLLDPLDSRANAQMESAVAALATAPPY